MFTERVQSVEDGAPGVDPQLPLTRGGRRDRTEARVLTAADALFSSRGYADTSIRAIAGEASVSVGRVIAVGDKERLLVLTMEQRLRAIHVVRTSQAVQDGGTHRSNGVEDAIADLVRPFIAIYTEAPGLAREFAAILARGRTQSSVFAELAERLEAEFSAVFAGVSAGSAVGAARTLYLVFIGVLYTAAHGALPFDRIEDEVRTAVRVLQGSTVQGSAVLQESTAKGRTE